jgi:DNA-binding MarR family transcriptional regulator
MSSWPPVNRLGAAALVIDDAVRARIGDTAAGDHEALVALVNFADGRRIDELRAALGLSQPGAAHLVTRLERAGLATRSRDPSDGRAVLVGLTPRGRTTARAVVAAREAAIRDSLGVLSAGEQGCCACSTRSCAARPAPVATPGASAACATATPVAIRPTARSRCGRTRSRPEPPAACRSAAERTWLRRRR